MKLFENRVSGGRPLERLAIRVVSGDEVVDVVVTHPLLPEDNLPLIDQMSEGFPSCWPWRPALQVSADSATAVVRAIPRCRGLAA